MVQSYKPLPQPPSALQAVGNVLDTPFFAADALVRGGKGYTNTAELGKVVKEVREHGSRGLEDVAERYNLFSPEQLKDQAAHGDAVSGYFLKHPIQAGVADFVSEFANPSNFAVPPVARLAGKAIGGAAKIAGKVPEIKRAATTVRDTFNPAAGLRDEGGIRAQDAGRQFTQAASIGADEAHKRLDPIFRGTSLADRNEIERRSENFTKHGIVNPPTRTPEMGLADTEIDSRAKDYRTQLDRLDAEQLQHGVATKRQLFTNHAYTPRYGGFGKIYAPGEHLTDEQKEFYETSNGGYGGSAKAYGGSTLGKRKTLYTYDDAARKGLSPTYDPANNAETHFADRLKKIEVLKSKPAFINAGVLHDVVLQKENGPGQLNTIFGANKPGKAALDRYVDITARKISRQQAVANLQANGVGIVKPPRSVNVGALKATAKGAAINAETAAGAEANIGAAYAKQQTRATDVLSARMAKLKAVDQQKQIASDVSRLSQPVQTAVTQAARGSQKAARLASAAITHYAYGAITSQQSIAFTREATRLFPGIKTGLRESVVNTSIQAAEKKGFVRLSGDLSKQFGPEGYLVMGKPKTIQYLLDMGAPREQATGVAGAFDTINKLTRIGIISNPFVHVIWNLNTQFLGAGGHPEDFVKIYGNKVLPASIARAEKYGAIARFADSGKGLFGMSYGKKIGSGANLTGLEQVDRQVSRAYDYNNHIVFHHFETRFSSMLFDRIAATRHATTEPELMQVGRDVRKALGDYANVSQHGVEGIANRMFFFYPWLKTVTPFWLASIVEHPGRVNAPLEAIRAHNQLAGDPNITKERPFTAYLGTDPKTGESRRAALPLPIKYADDALTAFAPKGDLGAGVGERVSDVLRVAGSHANPVVAAINDAIITSAAPPQEPGGSNYHTVYNREAPPIEQWKQFGTAAAERIIPLPLQVKQILGFADEAIRGIKHNVGGDAVSGSIFGVIGGSTYDQPGPQSSRLISVLQSTMMRVSNRLRQDGNTAEADKVYYKMQEMMDAAKRGKP